jgi:hypothetical protein
MCIKHLNQCGYLTVLCAMYNMVEFFLPFGMVSLLLWILLRPTHLQPRVDAAVLTQFSLLTNESSSSSTLDYDIAIDLSFHNRHSHLVVRYFDLTAVASFGGTRLGPSADVMDIFVQNPKATNVVHTVFQGSGVELDPAAAEAFAREAGANGSFNLLVTVASTVMYKVPILKPVYYYYHKCYITFPAASHGGGGDMLSPPGTLCSTDTR